MFSMFICSANQHASLGAVKTQEVIKTSWWSDFFLTLGEVNYTVRHPDSLS